MTESQYYIIATCIKKLECPNITFNIGDVFYINPKAQGNDMYLSYSYLHKRHLTEQERDFNYVTFGWKSYIPFTKQKRFAKKWKQLSYAVREKQNFEHNLKEYFNFEIKEIKVTYIDYTEEEL